MRIHEDLGCFKERVVYFTKKSTYFTILQILLKINIQPFNKWAMATPMGLWLGFFNYFLCFIRFWWSLIGLWQDTIQTNLHMSILYKHIRFIDNIHSFTHIGRQLAIHMII